MANKKCGGCGKEYETSNKEGWCAECWPLSYNKKEEPKVKVS